MKKGCPCARVAERLRHSVCAVYQSLSRVHHQLRLCVDRRLLDAGVDAEGGKPSLGKALT